MDNHGRRGGDARARSLPVVLDVPRPAARLVAANDGHHLGAVEELACGWELGLNVREGGLVGGGEGGGVVDGDEEGEALNVWNKESHTCRDCGGWVRPILGGCQYFLTHLQEVLLARLSSMKFRKSM